MKGKNRQLPWGQGLKKEAAAYSIFSLLCAVICFVLMTAFLFNTLVYLWETRWAASNAQKVGQAFQTFVTDHGIKSDDWIAIEEWDSETQGVKVMPDYGNRINTEHYASDDSSPSVLIIQFFDKEASVFIMQSELALPEIVALSISLVVALCAFLVVFYRWFNRKIDYIIEIENGVMILESGDLSHTIPIKGQDELGSLAGSINVMRDSIMERIASEDKAIQAGKEIIGDLSHEIRTPLTVILGFLPLLLKSDTLSDEHREYLMLIDNKAKQMSMRADELLEYATVYSGQQRIELESINAAALVSQFVNELNCILHVDAAIDMAEDTQLNGDIHLLARLFDNLLANIRQHADLTRPATVCSAICGEMLRLEISNTIRAGAGPSGKSLGLKISRYILQQHGGKIDVRTSDSQFITVITLPKDN